MHIPQFLAERQVRFETLIHPLAFTAQRRARYLHLPMNQVAKAILLEGPSGYFLAVLAADRQVSTPKLAAYLGGPVRLGSRDEVARIFTDCQWGVTSPFGSHYNLPILLDESLDPDAAIVLESQTYFEAVRLSCRDYERLENARRLQFAV